MATRHWRDLSATQRSVLLTLMSAEVALTATAAVDLVRRPPSSVRGGRVWWLLIFVQPVGPLGYLFWARRRG